jgi:hypothetical protein
MVCGIVETAPWPAASGTPPDVRDFIGLGRFICGKERPLSARLRVCDAEGYGDEPGAKHDR